MDDICAIKGINIYILFLMRQIIIIRTVWRLQLTLKSICFGKLKQFTFKVGQFKKNCTSHLTLILKFVFGGWLFSSLFIFVGGKNHLVATLWLVTHLWPCQSRSRSRVFLRPGAHRRLETGVWGYCQLLSVLWSNHGTIQHKHISGINYLSDFHSFSVASTEWRITTHSYAFQFVLIVLSCRSEWFLEHEH